MKITVTFGDIMDSPLLSSWDMFCEDKGYNPWFLNEGLGSEDEEVELTLEEARKYGLLEGLL